MLLMIRSFLNLRIDNAPKQQGLLSNLAQAVKYSAEEIAGEIERVLGPQVDD